MFSFASIPDQERPVRILRNLLQNKSIPHALLFTGLEGVGKLRAATVFAMHCNCTGSAASVGAAVRENPADSCGPSNDLEPCGACPPCRKIISGNHPDVIHVKPTGAFIRIAQIRALCETLSMKPYEADMRIVIISEAHSLNPAAGNALLKMLEEPPDRTVLILTAPQTADLLPTIVSRCQPVRFNPVRRSTIASRLVAEHDLPPEDAAVLAALADGRMNRAVEWHQSGWLHYRNWLTYASGLEDPENLAARDTGLLLAFAEKLALRKEQALASLDALAAWLRDLTVCRYAPERVLNADRIDKLLKVSQKLPVEDLMKKIDIIRTAQKHIDANANLRLTLEVMMLRLADKCRHPEWNSYK